MNIIAWRTIYLFCCIGSRCGIIIFIVKTNNPMDLYCTGVFYIFVASKFIFLDFLQRPSIESFLFAYYAMKYNTDYCWKILVADLVFGTCVYIGSNLIPNIFIRQPILPK